MKKYMKLHDDNGIVYIREKYIESARPALESGPGTLISMVSGTTIYVDEDIKDIKW